MVMRPDVMDAAISAAMAGLGDDTPKLYFSPRGKKLDQNLAQELASTPDVVMIAGRYEGLDQRGVFDGQGQLTPAQVVNTLITSDSENNIYTPQVGMRIEASNRWLTLGVQPKFGMGVNQYRGSVYTEQLRSVGDDPTRTTESGEKLSVNGELAVYGKLHINKHVSMTVGYTFLFADNVSRAHNSIYYNDNGQSEPPAVVSKPGFDLMYYQGLNVGGEIRY